MEITLTRQNDQVRVHMDGTESHAFALADLAPGAAERDALAKRLNPWPWGARLCRALLPDDSRAPRT